MSRYYLTRISVEGFRGINNEADPLVVHLDPTKVSSLFAVNAAGKTSVFDALCYAILGKVPKLERLLADQKPEKYYCNCFHGSGTGTIEIDVQDANSGTTFTLKVVRDQKGNRAVSSPTHPDPSGLLSSLAEPFVLLDYRMFMQFVEDTSLVRGRSMGPLLGLTNYAKLAKGLEAAAESRSQRNDLGVPALEQERSSLEADQMTRLQEVVSAYDAVVGVKPTTSDVGVLSSDVQAAIAKERTLTADVAGRTLDQIDFEALNKKLSALEGGKDREELAGVMASLATTTKLLDLLPAESKTEQEQILALIDERDALLKLTQGDVVQRLLASAETLFKSGSWSRPTTCPLCGSELAFPIAEHVAKNLKQYEEAALKVLAIKELWKSSKWVARLSQLEMATALAVAAEARLDNEVRQAGVSGSISETEIATATTHAADLETRLAATHASLENRRADLEAKLPASLVLVTTKLAACKRFLDSAAALRAARGKLVVAKQKLLRREQWKTFIELASVTFMAAEAQLAKQRLARIAPDYEAMFSDIMKTDDVLPRLERDPSGQELAIDLKSFHGKSGVSAQALLSESYRNALAVSVFLAAAKEYSGSAKFIIFDDVTSSFDSGHQLFLMEVIRTKVHAALAGNGLQVILLTHDGSLRKYCNTMASETTQWEHQEMTGNAPKGRVKASRENSELAKGKALTSLGKGDVAGAEPYVRDYLEYKLEQIVRRLKIPVPLELATKADKRMVSGWLGAIKDAIALHKAAGTLVLDVQQMKDVDTIHVYAIIANWVSHFETGQTMPVTPAALTACIKGVDGLAECFRYDFRSGATTTREWYRSLSAK